VSCLSQSPQVHSRREEPRTHGKIAHFASATQRPKKKGPALARPRFYTHCALDKRIELIRGNAGHVDHGAGFFGQPYRSD
jgi:hypothetical protein